MASMTPHQQAQQLEQCINDCKCVLNDLQHLTQKANDISLQSSLKESIHHLEMCIHECTYAAKSAL